MDRGAWQAIDYGVARDRNNLATKPPPPSPLNYVHILIIFLKRQLFKSYFYNYFCHILKRSYWQIKVLTNSSYLIFAAYSYHFLFFFLAMPCGLWESWFPDQGMNLGPGQWKHQVLNTGPPRKYQAPFP